MQNGCERGGLKAFAQCGAVKFGTGGVKLIGVFGAVVDEFEQGLGDRFPVAGFGPPGGFVPFADVAADGGQGVQPGAAPTVVGVVGVGQQLEQDFAGAIGGERLGNFGAALAVQAGKVALGVVMRLAQSIDDGFAVAAFEIAIGKFAEKALEFAAFAGCDAHCKISINLSRSRLQCRDAFWTL